MSTDKDKEGRTWKRTEIPAENPDDVRSRDNAYLTQPDGWRKGQIRRGKLTQDGGDKLGASIPDERKSRYTRKIGVKRPEGK